MKQYRTCPYCGAHLDPGERCDCREDPVMDMLRSGELEPPALSHESTGGDQDGKA